MTDVLQEDVGQDDVEGEEVNDPELQVKGKSISPNKKVNKICPIKPMKMCGEKKEIIKTETGMYISLYFKPKQWLKTNVWLDVHV